MINNNTLDTEFIDYSFLKIYKLPDLTKYINLKVLYCNNAKLTELTNLPNTLINLALLQYKTFKLIYFVKSGSLYIFKKEIGRAHV